MGLVLFLLLVCLSCVLIKLCIVNILVCAGAYLCVCVYELRIVTTDNILHFINSLILIISLQKPVPQ